jgi:hypothetical protein
MMPIPPRPIAKAAPRDTYLDAVEEHRGIYAYPYDSFKSELTTRGQASLTKQYEEALRDGKIVVFVRDDDERKLVSYSIER